MDDKCYACIHVVTAECSVLYVCREDGALIMACGTDHRQSADDWKVIHPQHVIGRDPGVALVADLDDGQQAERASVECPWERGPISD